MSGHGLSQAKGAQSKRACITYGSLRGTKIAGINHTHIIQAW